MRIWLSPPALNPQAFAGFYYTFDFLNLTSLGSAGAATSAVQSFCRREWTEVSRGQQGPVPVLCRGTHPAGRWAGLLSRFLTAPCPPTAPQLLETYPQAGRYLHSYCATATYILTLLLEGYKFDEQTWSHIHFSRQVKPLASCATALAPSHGCHPAMPAQLHSSPPAPDLCTSFLVLHSGGHRS